MRRLSVAVVLLGAILVFSDEAQARMTPECQEGGVGESSCALSHCSISCSSAYYACCNLDTGCKCVPGGES
jgi:hypothetical protein